MRRAVREPESRHPTLRERRAGRTAFVKLAHGPDDRVELAREAEILGLIAARCPQTAERLPELLGWDARAGRLTLEEIQGRDLRRIVLRNGRLPEESAAQLGRAAALLHEEGRRLADDPPAHAPGAGAVDWHRPAPGHLRLLSLAGVELIQAVQRSAPLCGHLDRLLARRPGDTLVHGDLRWENVLVEDDDARPLRVRLVDWELAGWGEAAWDVACFMAACLGAWLSTTPHVPGVPPDRLADLAEVPLPAVRPALVAFWTAYVGTRGLEGHGLAAWAERCTELVAVRLVHLAMEATQGDEYLRTAPVAHVQVALNVLDDPARAAAGLLGIAP